MSLDLTGLIADMRSPDFVIQGPALREAARVARVLASEAVQALATSTARAAVADELSAFGSIEPLLGELLTQDVDAETKVFASTLLLHFGSKAGVECLLAALRNGKGPTLHIAMWLGKAGVTEGAEIIAKVPQRWDLQSDPHGAATLIAALRRLVGDLPEGLRSRVEAEAVDPYRAALLKCWERPAAQN